MSIVIYIILFRDKVLNKEIQDLEKYYRLNGAIYICKTSKLLEEKSFILKKKIFAYIMDRKNSIDIDEIFKISSSSLETITLSIYLLFKAASIVYAIRGLPHKSSTFLRGSLLLPPRAGIIAKNVLFVYINYFFSFQIGFFISHVPLVFCSKISLL